MTRDLDAGGVISRIFGIYRDQASVLLPAAAAVFLLEALVSELLIQVSPVFFLAAIVVQIIAGSLFTGMVVELVRDVQDGRRDHSVGELLGAVRGAVLPLILAGFLVGLLVALGLILLIVPGLILLTLFAVVSPVIVVERTGVIGALGRSRELVSGNGLQVFLVIFVMFVISVVVGILFGVIGATAGTIGAVLAGFVASTLTAPLTALAAAVLYFELLRIKGEPAGPAGTPDVAAWPGDDAPPSPGGI